MALLDIFKKKPTRQFKGKEGKRLEKAVKVKEAEKKAEKTEKVEKVKKVTADIPVKPKKILGESYKVLKRAHVTEKAANLTEKNQYIFDVFPRSNKNQIKKAVEDVYGIDVVAVRIINIPKKKRRLGRIEGWRHGYKKAIVKIKEGQKIEVLPR